MDVIKNPINVGEIFEVCSAYYMEECKKNKLLGVYWPLEALKQAQKATQHIVTEEAFRLFYDPEKWRIQRKGQGFEEGDAPFIDAALYGKNKSKGVRVEYEMGAGTVCVYYGVDCNEEMPLDDLLSGKEAKGVPKDTLLLFGAFVKAMRECEGCDYHSLDHTFLDFNNHHDDFMNGFSSARAQYPEIFAVLDHKTIGRDIPLDQKKSALKKML